MDVKSGVQDIIGRVTLLYEDGIIHINGAHEEKISIKDIDNANITLRRDFGFIYNDLNYMIKMDKYSASFLRIVQDKY